MQLGALKNTTGCSGIGEPVSFAWSLKLSPIATNFDGVATQGPSRGLPLTSGSFFGSSFASSFKFAGRERRAVDVLHLPRQVAQLAVGVDEAGLFLAGGSVAYEFHLCLLGRWLIEYRSARLR